MRPPRNSGGVALGRPIAWAALCIGGLALAPSAVAAPSTPSGLTQIGNTNAQQVTVSWTASEADPLGLGPVRYEGGLGPSGASAPTAPAPLGATTSTSAALVVEGSFRFFVRAVQDPVTPGTDPLASSYSSTLITVDRTPPTITVAFPPPNGLNGWHVGQSGLRISATCGDTVPQPVTGCAPVTWTAQTKGATQGFTAVDAAGNRTSAVSAVFKFDRIAPTPRGILAPGPNATLTAEPTFVWTRFDDGTSGTDRYEVQYRIGNPSTGPYSPTLLASVTHPPPGLIQTVSTVRNVLATALPAAEDVWWRVRTFDLAGNSSLTRPRRLRIDPTALAAPTITAGPSGPTNVTTPSFSWVGDQPQFSWDVTRPDETEPIESDTGAATSVTLQRLDDGDYTFRVSQGPPGSPASAEVTRSFEVDTTPPPAPVITARPSSSAGPSVYSWSTVPGAVGRWTVVGGGGVVVQGPSDAPTGTATLSGLSAGGYEFRVVAVDAAGNASSAAISPFAISAVATAVPTATAPRKQPLPKQNALRLRPKAGALLFTLRPLLRWDRGPRRTTVYNVQLFRVGTNASGRQTLKKVASSFPRTTRVRLSKKVEPGACYIWRVWPYVGNRFAAKALGVSNFCVASAKVLRAREKAAKAKALRR